MCTRIARVICTALSTRGSVYVLFPVLLCLLFLMLLNGCVREHQTARLKSAKDLLGRQEKDLHRARRKSLVLEQRAQELEADLEKQKATEEERVDKKVQCVQCVQCVPCVPCVQCVQCSAVRAVQCVRAVRGAY